VTTAEAKGFIAVILNMGIRKPSIETYWLTGFPQYYMVPQHVFEK
jgi:hypothetical protein